MDNFNYESFVPEMGYYAYRKCDESWGIGEAYIDFVDLTYVLDGEADYFINGVPHTAAKGDILCIPKGSARKATIKQGNIMKCYCANFQLRDLNGNDVELPFPIIFQLGSHPDIIDLFQDIALEWTRCLPGYRLKIRGLFSLILYRLLELEIYKVNLPSSDNRIDKTIQYIMNNYSGELKISTFAQQMHLNTAYFGSLFKSVTGMSFNQFVREVRLKNAEDLLKLGNHSVKAAATACGFQDAFYFSKVFKQKYGYAPSKLLK